MDLEKEWQQLTVEEYYQGEEQEVDINLQYLARQDLRCNFYGFVNNLSFKKVLLIR